MSWFSETYPISASSRGEIFRESTPSSVALPRVGSKMFISTSMVVVFPPVCANQRERASSGHFETQSAKRVEAPEFLPKIFYADHWRLTSWGFPSLAH